MFGSIGSGPRDSLRPVRERPDRVQVATRYGVDEIPWEARKAILHELHGFEETGGGAIRAFEVAGATRPVELDRQGRAAVVDAINLLAKRAAGGFDDLDPQVLQLLHDLNVELDADD